MNRLTDSLFVGAGVVPVTLFLGGHPGPALLVMIPLLLIACLCGMAERIDDGESSGED